MSELTGATIIASGFLALLAGAEFWHHRWHPPAEWTRKLVHCGGGLIALILPFVVTSHWTVLVLAAGMGSLFVVSKHCGMLPSVHAIDRPSRGAEFYPIVVYTLFLLAGDENWKYIAAVLNLAVADTLAALIGKRFGRIRYRVADQFKSLEGSLAFYVTSLACTASAIFWFDPLAGQADRLSHYWLASNLVALLVTCFEAISQRGQDNLWIPLGALLVLSKTFQTDVSDLWLQNFSFLSILLVSCLIGRRYQAFEFAAVLVFCLAGYGCWAMGSFDWAWPAFASFLVYVAGSHWLRSTWHLQVSVVTWSVIVPIAILACANVCIQLDRWDAYQFLYGPFLGATALSLTQAVANAATFHWAPSINKPLGKPQAMVVAILAAVVVTSAFILIAYLRNSLPDSLTAVWLAGITAVLASFSAQQLRAANPEEMDSTWLAFRTALNLLAALIAIAAQLLGFETAWNPA